MTNNRFHKIRSYLSRYRGYLIFGAISLALTNGLMLGVPYVSKIVVDLLEQGAHTREVGYWALGMVGLAIGAGFFRFLTRRTIIWMSRRIEYDFRGELVDHLLKLSPSFYDNSRTGDIMVRVTSDMEAVRMMVGPGIMQISNALFTVVLAVPMMLYLSVELTLYSLAPALVLPFLVNRLGNLVHKKSMAIQEHFSRLTATAQENLAGIRVVKAYRQEEAEIEHFDEMSRRYYDLNFDMGRLQALFYPLIQTVGLSLTLAILYFGGRQVIQANLPLGTIVAFLGYLSMLLWPLMAVGWVVSLYQRGIVSLDRINSILHTEPQISDNGSGLRREQVRGAIEIKDLTFAYDNTEVLKNISVSIERGETIGLMGPTGCGKTTLVSLLARLYRVDDDKIFVDGVDINQWELASLRSQIGFATQEPFLFSDTIAANVAFGVNDVNIVGVEEYAELAALGKDVRGFPNQFETVVGERGITLSGGQKQRTAVARALMIEPAILVLDDATSSVDTETEHEVNERIHKHSRDLTTIVISHRVSSVKDADRIFFMEAGRIVEQGTHDELLSLDGLYAALHQAQLLQMELEQL